MNIHNLLQKYEDIDHSVTLSLIESITRQDKAFLLAHQEYNLTKKQLTTLDNLIIRYKEKEPIQLLLGEIGFYKSMFKVNSDNLIPRSETELLVELVLKEIQSDKYDRLNILEVGYGTGCISISILKELQATEYLGKINLTATDINPKSKILANANAKQNLTKDALKHLVFQTVDILEDKIGIKYDLIVSNPPYIPTKDYFNLDKSVLNFEPRLALDGGTHGVTVYEAILKRIKPHISSRTVCFFEIYHTKKFREELIELTHSIYPNAEVTYIKDLKGKFRFCKISSML